MRSKKSLPSQLCFVDLRQVWWYGFRAELIVLAMGKTMHFMVDAPSIVLMQKTNLCGVTIPHQFKKGDDHAR
jgi:hypothetical protein